MPAEARRILVNYANRRLYRAQAYNAWTALQNGRLTHHASYGRGDLDPGFVAANRPLLSVPRGAGYWLWKPFIVLKTLRHVRPGDAVVYCDSGAVFLGQVDPLVEACQRSTLGTLGFDLGALEESTWTKRDAFVLMGCDRPAFQTTPQLMASFIVFVSTDASIAFVEQWLAYAEDPDIIADRPAVCGQPDLPNFRAHRHDQSVFSLLYKSWGLESGHRFAPGALDRVVRLTRRDPRLGEACLSDLSLTLDRSRWKPEGEAPPDPVRALWQQGRAMLEARDVDGAVDTLGRLLELAEVDPPGRGRTLLGLPFFLASVHERLAPCHFRRRDFAKAATHYARANALQPVQRDTAIKHRLCVSLAGGAIKSSHCLDAAGGRGYRAEMGMPGSSDG